MKRILSFVLAMIMCVSLFGAMSLSAYAGLDLSSYEAFKAQAAAQANSNIVNDELDLGKSGGDSGSSYRKLKITIPENMDYDGLFEDVFEKYTNYHELVKVKTTNMGTLFELSYDVRLKDAHAGKQFIDDLRCRNGNLSIMFSREIEKELI